MASTPEPRSGNWRVWWRIGGRGGRKQSVTLPTLDLAQAAKALAESRQHRVTDAEVYKAVLGIDPLADASIPTLDEWVRDWHTQRRRSRSIQPDTLAEYQRIYDKHIAPRLGRLRLTQVTVVEVRDWVAWASDQPGRRGGLISAQTVRHAHAVLHQILAAAVPQWIVANPASNPPGAGRKVNHLPKVPDFEPMYLTKDEIRIILAACDDHIRDMALVALRTGMRLGELAMLRVGACELDTSPPRVWVMKSLKHGQVEGDPKSRRGKRPISVSPTVKAVLAARIRGKASTALVFPSPAGTVWRENNLNARHWQPAIGRAMRCAEHPPPQPVKPARGPTRQWGPWDVSTCDCPTRLHRRPRFHDLRHTHADSLMKAGWDVLSVSARIGHAKASTTLDVYGNRWPDPQADRVDAIDDD